jgi:hypothetical protein
MTPLTTAASTVSIAQGIHAKKWETMGKNGVGRRNFAAP